MTEPIQGGHVCEGGAQERRALEARKRKQNAENREGQC